MKTYHFSCLHSFTQLVTDDNIEMPLAIYNKSHSGLFSTPRPATLDITPQGMHILDDIVTTFVWFEHKRRESSRSTTIAVVAGASA
jgi:hypothetical protein